MSSDFLEEQKRKRIDHLQKMINITEDKIYSYEEALKISIDETTRFKYKYELGREYKELKELENKLSELLDKIQASPENESYPTMLIRIISRQGNKYPVTVVNSPVGLSSKTIMIKNPLTSDEIEDLHWYSNINSAASTKDVKRYDKIKEKLRNNEYGRKLFDILFQDEIRDIYNQSLEKTNRKLTIRLWIEPSNLVNVPWELLYDTINDYQISLVEKHRFARYQGHPKPELRLPVELPLRFLYIISRPIDLQTIATSTVFNKVWTNLIEKLDDNIDMDTCPANIEYFSRLLNRKTYHIIHFDGHSDFIENQGILYFENKEGKKAKLKVRDFALIIHNTISNIKLIVLNTCRSAIKSSNVVHSSIASQLIQAGIPAVLSMQYNVRVDTAKKFMGEFYYSLANGKNLEEATVSARLKIKTSNSYDDWFTPVLYMRTASGPIVKK